MPPPLMSHAFIYPVACCSIRIIYLYACTWPTFVGDEWIEIRDRNDVEGVNL